jgi:hypothetical protein
VERHDVASTVRLMLSDEQFRRFASAGYIVLPQVVLENLFAAADDELDARLGSVPSLPGPRPHRATDEFWAAPAFHPLNHRPRLEAK